MAKVDHNHDCISISISIKIITLTLSTTITMSTTGPQSHSEKGSSRSRCLYIRFVGLFQEHAAGDTRIYRRWTTSAGTIDGAERATAIGPFGNRSCVLVRHLPSGNIDDKHAHIAQHVTLSFSGVELREGVRACKRACLCLGHRFALLANMESGKHVRFSVVHRTWLNGNGQCEYGFQGLGYCRFECAPDKPTGLEDEGF